LNTEVEKMSEQGETEIKLFSLLSRVNCQQASQEANVHGLKRLKSTGSFTHQMTRDLVLKKVHQPMDTS